MKLVLWFAVYEDARYFSHRDTMTVWQRALIRAGIPVLYSSGFNPHTRITLPLPRSVGVNSEQELLVVYLADECSPDRALEQLHRQLPNGLVLLAAGLIPRQMACQPASAGYRLVLGSQVNLDVLRQRVELFQIQREWVVSRPNTARHARKSIDLKHAITDLRLSGQNLEFTLRIDPGGTPRLEEIRSAFDLQPDQVLQILRLHTEYPDLNHDSSAFAATSQEAFDDPL